MFRSPSLTRTPTSATRAATTAVAAPPAHSRGASIEEDRAVFDTRRRCPLRRLRASSHSGEPLAGAAGMHQPSHPAGMTRDLINPPILRAGAARPGGPAHDVAGDHLPRAPRRTGNDRPAGPPGHRPVRTGAR